MLQMTKETETAISEPYFDYLQCLNCGYILGEVTEHEGKTVLSFEMPDGEQIHVFKAEVQCPLCHEIREFYSSPMSAVRLKKWIKEDDYGES